MQIRKNQTSHPRHEHRGMHLHLSQRSNRKLSQDNTRLCGSAGQSPPQLLGAGINSRVGRHQDTASCSCCVQVSGVRAGILFSRAECHRPDGTKLVARRGKVIVAKDQTATRVAETRKRRRMKTEPECNSTEMALWKITEVARCPVDSVLTEELR
ncbi:hypothetical protein VTK56DRAFT_8027 [Thermocarpiscus australiensis]